MVGRTRRRRKRWPQRRDEKAEGSGGIHVRRRWRGGLEFDEEKDEEFTELPMFFIFKSLNSRVVLIFR